MSKSKCIRDISSRNDIIKEKTSVLNKRRSELTSNVGKKKDASLKEKISIGSDSKSSSRIYSHSKNVEHYQKDSLTKKSKNSTCHKKSSNYQTSKKFMSNNSTKNNSIEAGLCTYEREEASSKHITNDPFLDVSEGYNSKYPDLFLKSKSTKKEYDTNEPNLFLSSKSIKRECATYEPSVKRKCEIMTVCESKPKKLKSDQISKKKNKHPKHSAQESKSQSEKVQFLNQKKEHNECLDNFLKEKSSKSNSSKSTARESRKREEKSSKMVKLKINSTVEFTSSEANFEDCLGLNDIVIKKKKNSKPIQNATKTDNKTQPKVTIENYKHSSSHSSHPATPKKSSSVQKEKLHTNVLKSETVTKVKDVDIMSTLPQTLPKYRPLPRVESYSKKKEVLSNEDAVLFMSSKREKTAVYSGRRNFSNLEVPSLLEMCSRVLIDNIDDVEFLGDIPYNALKPMLEKCNPQQLLHIEYYNPRLSEVTDELWEIHCKRYCKLLKPDENGSYRELFLDAQNEREKKLKSITANISASMSKYNPARVVKLAYVDSVAKPPRDVARRQAKNGTANPVYSVKASPPSKETPRPVGSVVNSASDRPSVPNHVIKNKPKVAPLMAKTLKSMKMCFRRK